MGIECPCGIHRNDCDYHKPQHQEETYKCGYPFCTNNGVYFGHRKRPPTFFDYICKEHYSCMLDMFKKYYTLPVDLTE